MQDWLIYAMVIGVFFLSHSIPVRPTVKSRITDRWGRRGFTLGYSTLSTAVLILVIVAAKRAPFVPLWTWEPWHNHLTILAMLLACVVAALAFGRPNPLSFGGRDNHLFDPENAGIIGWFRHPLLVSLLLWSLGHLVPNGDLAHVILFALFASFSLLGMRLIDRRNRRLLGAANWAALAQTTRRITPSASGVLRAGTGIGVFVILLLLHGPVLGAYPLP